MANRTVANISQDTLKIQRYLEEKSPGDFVSYGDIFRSTGVEMDTDGKMKLRSALYRAKLEYSPVIGKGIRLADAKSTMGIVTHKLHKIDRAVKRSERTHKNLESQFFDTLSPAEQKQILFLGSVFGAIRVAANQGRIIYSKNPKGDEQNYVKIPMLK